MMDVSWEVKDKQRRQRARQQLLKLNKRKREVKIADLLKQLSQHLELRAQQENVDIEEYQLLLEDAGHDSDEVISLVISNTLQQFLGVNLEIWQVWLTSPIPMIGVVIIINIGVVCEHSDP